MRLQSALEASGYKTRSYSGRGMMGKSCLGAQVASIGDVFRCGVSVGRYWVTDTSTEQLTPRVDVSGFEIILYWPNTEYKESAEDSSDVVMIRGESGMKLLPPADVE